MRTLNFLNLRKLWLSLLLLVGATAIAIPGIQEIAEDGNVAKIGDTEYATLQAAIDAAESGSTIKLLQNVDATGYYSNNTTRMPISKSMTINGNGHTVTVAGRGFGVGMNATSKIDVTFKDITIQNNVSGGRCIDTRGNIGTLTIFDSKLCTGGGNYDQTLTIGGNQSDAATVNITNSTIQTNDAGTAYYAITTFNPVNMTISNSTIKGWACIYAKGPDGSAGSAGSVINIDGSTLISKNIYNGDSNDFGLFTMEDNNVNISVTNSDIQLTNNGNNPGQVIACFSSTYTGNISLGEGNNVTFNGSGTTGMAINDNNATVSISGGSFNVEVPEEYLADGCIYTRNANGTYSIVEGEWVAAIDETKYATLAEAIAAVPTNGTETTITMIGNEIIAGNGVTVVKTQNIVLDLNGKTISQTGPMTGTSYLIKNNGTLTVKDSSDTEKNGTGTGKMTCTAENPDTGDIPSYANNLFSNYGTLNIESGYFQTLTNAGYASFVVDNYSGGTANISGGKLCNNASYAYVVRMFLNSTTTDNTLNISGTAEISGTYAVWMQYANANANKGTLNISGGTINASSGRALYAGSAGGNKRIATNVNVTISGGTINGTGGWLGADTEFNSISITGGRFADFGVSSAGGTKFVTGGVYESINLFVQDRMPNQPILAEGYKCVLDNGLYYVVSNNDPRKAVDFAPLYANKVYYYWLNNDGSREGGMYDFYAPFAGPDVANVALMDGEFIELLGNVKLDKDVTYIEELPSSWNADPIYKGGTFSLTFGEFDIDVNGYKFPIPTGVSIKTDKQTNIFSALDPDYKVIETAITDGDFIYQYSVVAKTYVAQIGDVKYESLEEAIAAISTVTTVYHNKSDMTISQYKATGTVTLLADCEGNGIVIDSGSNLTIDFAGHTYSVIGNLVGSNGTESQGFQLLQNSTVTFKSTADEPGKITSSKANFLVQNYSNLTLENMTFDGSALDGSGAYTLSNNNGNVVIDNSTITAKDGEDNFAFDVCRYSSYPSVGVTVKGESVINGNIEVSASGSDAKDGFSLMLESGSITGDIVVDASAGAAIAATPDKAVIKENDSFNQAAPTGYMWVSDGEGTGTSTLAPRPYVAQIGDVKYWSLADAVAAVPADGTETTITMIDNEMINVVGYAITIPATKNVVIDLNGYQVVGTVEQEGTSALIRNLGTLTIKDSSDTNKDGTGTGKLMSGANPTWTWDGTDNYAGSYASNLIRNEKDLIIESGNLYNMSTGSASYAIDNYSAGNVTINGGKVDAAKASAIRMFYVNGGSITVNDGIVGHYTSDEDCSYMGIQVMSGSNINVSVKGGTLVGLYALYANNTGGCIDVSGGTFDGDVAFGSAGPNDISISNGSFNYWVGTWGNQTKFISGGIYAEPVDDKYIADGCILSTNTDPETKDAYPYIVKQGKFICAIGTTKYETLADAVAAAGTAETTITLLTEAATDGVISGNGVVVPSGSNITFDLNGLTYDVSGETVGSTNTKTSGFQLLQGSNITFKNGTLKATSPTAQMLIQNYSNLTLEDVTLDGTTLSGVAYALSNNSGTVNLTGSTSITAKEGGRAFDTYKFGSYAIPTVNINTTGTITGPIEATGGKLNIENGQFNVTWVTDKNYTAGDIQIIGGIFTAEPAEEYCAEGYVVTDNTDEETSGTYPYAVMSKEDAGIFELIDGKVYPYLDYTEDKEAASVSYIREFKKNNKGQVEYWQPLFIPFDINDVTELTDRYEFAKIHMVALENDGTYTTGDKIEVYYTKITSGKIYANKPYLIKPKKIGKDTIVVKNTWLRDTHNITPMTTSTMSADYIFRGTYTSVKATKTNTFFAMGGGTINFCDNTTLGSYRWYMKPEPKNDNYAKPTIIFMEGDVDATGISATGTDSNAEIEGYYTINGVRSDVPVKGMNIVKYKNGKTKKVMIK